jgi:hypothetical protein
LGEHRVIGANGVHFVHVHWGGRITCDCGDFVNRKARNNPTVSSPACDMCKHCAAVVKAAPQFIEEPHTFCGGTGILQDEIDFIKPHHCIGCRGTGIAKSLQAVRI